MSGSAQPRVPGALGSHWGWWGFSGSCPGGWNSWSAWGDCTKDCGGGLQTRMRSCKPLPNEGLVCEGVLEEGRLCNRKACNSKWRHDPRHARRPSREEQLGLIPAKGAPRLGGAVPGLCWSSEPKGMCGFGCAWPCPSPPVSHAHVLARSSYTFQAFSAKGL